MHPHACQNDKIGADTQNKGANQFQRNINTYPQIAPIPIIINKVITHPTQDVKRLSFIYINFYLNIPYVFALIH